MSSKVSTEKEVQEKETTQKSKKDIKKEYDDKDQTVKDEPVNQAKSRLLRKREWDPSRYYITAELRLNYSTT